MYLDVGGRYLLMLVAMAYNVGLFIAVVAGEGVGFLLFGSGLLFPSHGSAAKPSAACH